MDLKRVLADIITTNLSEDTVWIKRIRPKKADLIFLNTGRL